MKSKDCAETIISLRKKAGLTQYELAEKLQVAQATVYGWEAGKMTDENTYRALLRVKSLLNQEINIYSGTFAEQLRDIRAQTGLSQQEVAEIAGVNRQCISYWERGKSKPKGWDLYKRQQLISNLISYANAKSKVVARNKKTQPPLERRQRHTWKLVRGTTASGERRWDVI